MKQKEATVLLEHGQVKVAGPQALVKSIELIALRTAGDQVKAHQIGSALLKDWYVFCSVTGEPISVADLQYWNVERKEVYKDAETALKRHQELNKKE